MSIIVPHLEHPNLLAIEVSGHACSVALLPKDQTFPDKVLASHVVAPMQQAKLLLPTIESILNLSAMKIEHLGALAYGCGPGSFTGLRLACSVVQAIGFKVNIPVIPVSSLAALAQTVYMETGWDKVCVALNARKDQIYLASYQIDENGVMQPVMSESLVSINEIRLPVDKDWYFAGDGWDLCSGHLKHQGVSAERISSITAASAMAILPIAMQKLAQGQSISALDAIPVYLNPYKS